MYILRVPILPATVIYNISFFCVISNLRKLPFPPPGDLPNPGNEPMTSMSSALQADSLLLSHWKSLRGEGNKFAAEKTILIDRMWAIITLLFLVSHSVMSDSLLLQHAVWLFELQHARLPCHSPSPGACSHSCPLIPWCHPTISSSVMPFSSHLQLFPGWWPFPMSQLFTSGGQSIGTSASASATPVNIHDWFLLGLTGLISLQFKHLSRVLPNTTFRKNQFFCIQTFLWSNSHIDTRLLENHSFD